MYALLPGAGEEGEGTFIAITLLQEEFLVANALHRLPTPPDHAHRLSRERRAEEQKKTTRGIHEKTRMSSLWIN
jgi:hypothetical protein